MHPLSCRLAGLVVLGLVTFLSAAQDADNAFRTVAITVSPALRDKVLAELGKAGFVADKTSTERTLKGRLPQNALEKVAALDGIEKVVCGSAVPATGVPEVKSYKVVLRCRLDSDPLLRVQQWRGIVKRLEGVGFKKAKGWEGEDFYADTMEGTLPASALPQLNRERQLVTALLMPEGSQLPEEPTKPQLVRFHLTPDLGAPNQQEVADKTKEMLRSLGWKPAVGYDNQDHQRLMGWIPAGQLHAILRGKISTVAAAPENLVIEMALPNEANPLLAAGRVVVPFVLHYEPGTKRDDFIKSLEPYKVELINPDDPAQAAGRYVTGRVSTRLVNRLKEVDNFRKLDVDPANSMLRVQPIVRMDVLPDDGEPPADAPAAAQPSKISNDLRQELGKLEGDAASKPIRVEVVLRHLPQPGDNGWMGELQGDGMAVEGRIGPLVTGLVAPADVKQLAAMPSVSTIRLPQSARAWALPPVEGKEAAKLPIVYVPMGRRGEATTNLAQLVGAKEPRKSAVVGSDFRGYEQFVGKQLPKKTELLDFTGERSTDMKSDPVPDDGKQIGAGTQLALALMAAAPADELLLVRTAADAPYQVAKLINCTEGKGWQSAALDRREAELQAERFQLRDRRSALSVDRKLALDDFSDDALLRGIDNGFKEPLQKIRARYLAGEIDVDAARKECETLKLPSAYVDTYLSVWTYQKKQTQYDRDLAAHHAKLQRQRAFVSDTEKLRGVSTVLCGQWWSDGHSQLADQPGLRFLGMDRGPDQPIANGINWIQAVPRTTEQTWHGLFRDANHDDAMEFGPSTPTKRPEVNFMAWKPHAWSDEPGAKQSKLYWEQLPAGANVQAILQWREVHSATWKESGEDLYRQPLAPLKIVVLKQRDPAGKQLPADAFSVVATSTGLPDRLENDGRSATYQVKVSFTVPEGGGRYAIRIEGKQPDSSLPPAAAKIPNSQHWELQPKLTVDVTDAATRARGRVVLQDME